LITRPGGKAGWHQETPEAQCPGKHVFRYGLLPHAAGEMEDHTLLNEEAEHFHLPVSPIRRKNPGALELEDSFLGGLSGELVFSALKEAEDGQGYVIRVYNTTARPKESRVRFSQPMREAWISRLDEERLDPLPITSEGSLPLTVPPRGILTVRFTLQAPENSGGKI
jgi:alpha-mannosidase